MPYFSTIDYGKYSKYFHGVLTEKATLEKEFKFVFPSSFKLDPNFPTDLENIISRQLEDYTFKGCINYKDKNDQSIIILIYRKSFESVS